LKYKQPEFYEQKFPPECRNIPAFDQIIDLIVEKNYNNSPLKEILERQDEMIRKQEDNNKIEINSNTSLDDK
jgi:hypothetical protein